MKTWLLLCGCSFVNLASVVQVKRLVVVETEEMYKARKENQEKHQALRAPFVVSHLPTSTPTAVPTSATESS